ncbi:hypothetical protein [Paenibacillus sp. 8b26]|uniref:hypothetical protein n=1 Tax=Paenibacillus sp. 8b26 TaxID=3424133 RepID=UPI003D65FA4E
MKFDDGEYLRKIDVVINSLIFASHERRLAIIERCRILESKLINCTQNDLDLLIEIKYELRKIEADAYEANRHRKLYLFSALGIAAIVYGIDYLFINGLSLKEYFSYLVISVVGAFLYFLTSAKNESDAPLYKIIVALIIPFLFISFLFQKDNKVFDIWDKNLWSFILGYSSELLIKLLNKIIDKAKKVIE